MKKYPKVPQLQKLATEMVGDETNPDVFFVSVNGTIVMVTTVFAEAYRFWDNFAKETNLQVETCLENRCYGVIASVEPKDEGSSKFIRLDPPKEFLDRLEY